MMMNIQVDIKEGVDRIHLAQDKAQLCSCAHGNEPKIENKGKVIPVRN
jgi:hypothetical protein